MGGVIVVGLQSCSWCWGSMSSLIIWLHVGYLKSSSEMMVCSTKGAGSTNVLGSPMAVRQSGHWGPHVVIEKDRQQAQKIWGVGYLVCTG